MATDAIFLQDILKHPEDDALRLIYADWLEEHGDPDWAEFIRVQIASARLPPEQDSGPLEEVSDRAVALDWALPNREARLPDGTCEWTCLL